ncbi:MAG: hypothetical protein FWB71_05400 [Defluviitaleaceae bacterium]|nr:hypothetical protein [Defluviitaleaceae bacterium]
MGIETRVAQKDKLYSLLHIKRAYEKQSIVILPELEQVIESTIAVMEAEDVAYVEKIVT